MPPSAAPPLPPPPWIAGHRGTGRAGVENSVESLLAAVAEGADLVELDVQPTAEGELALCHDRTLERLAGDSRAVSRATWAELAPLALRAGRRRGRIARLEEALAALPTGYPVVVEAKLYGHVDRSRYAESIVARCAGRAGVTVSSFDRELLRALRRGAPALPLAPLGERPSRALLELGRELGAWAVHVGAERLDRAFVAEAVAAGLPVLAFTVNSVRRARALFGLGVAGLFSDRPGRLRAAFGVRAQPTAGTPTVAARPRAAR